jgi:hypothetical protein
MPFTVTPKMDWQSLYWLGAATVAALTVYNFVVGTGRKQGSTDVQIAHYEANEKAWGIRFDALANALSLHQSRTSERFESVVEKLNDALLVMAREHPTKADLQMVKTEILDRIDSQYGLPSTPRPRIKK